MSKRTVFTTITPLPAGISRDTVLDTLHDHLEMIDLNPLVEERHSIKPPPKCTAEEYHCLWYSLTDRVQYLPGGLASGKVVYNVCFHDLPMGIQTHCYAPMGLNIRGKWTLGGSLPGEPVAPVELGVGAPTSGLWLREDVDMRCNFLMTCFVKKTLQKAHSKLVERIVVKAQIVDAGLKNQQIAADAATLHNPISAQSPPSSNETLVEDPVKSPVLDLYLQSDPHTYRNNYDLSLYPKPLNTRSLNQTIKNPQKQPLYLDLPKSPKNAGARVSWQILNTANGRSPSMQQIDLAYQKASAFHRDSTVSELSIDGGRTNGIRDVKVRYPSSPLPTHVVEPVELE